MRLANINGGVFPQDVQRFYLELEVPIWSIIWKHLLERNK